MRFAMFSDIELDVPALGIKAAKMSDLRTAEARHKLANELHAERFRRQMESELVASAATAGARL